MAAGGNIFLRAFESLALVSSAHPGRSAKAFALSKPAEPGASPYVIERIEFIGNHRVQRDTLLARIFSRPGDPYSVDAVRRDFQALWNTHFFEDIRLEVEDSPISPTAKILRLLRHGDGLSFGVSSTRETNPFRNRTSLTPSRTRKSA